MTATTKGVRCAAGQWTLLADGKHNVLISMRTIGLGYLRTAAALPTDLPSPDASPTDTEYSFLTVSNLKPAAFSFSDTSTKIYLWAPGTTAMVAEVVSE